MKSSRLIAFDILSNILRDNAYSNLSIETNINDADLKDKAFITRIVYGVIERKITLDYVLNQFLKSNPKPKIKILLLMGAYQILYMDKVPNAVAVFETVKVADSLGLSYYKKLINAVLHKIIDFIPEFENIDDLSIKYSCPDNLINMWKKMYGYDNTLSILDAINNRPPIFAIPNKKYVDNEELLYELLNCNVECELFKDVVKINSSFNLTDLKPFNDGLFYIEDYSSYSAAKALGVNTNDVVLDICAAPGGKSFTIAQDLFDNGKIYSYDLHQHRVDLIRKTALRLNLTDIITDVNDATIFNDKIPLADKIICDVPCSGFGIIRRKPEIRYKNLDDIKDFPEIQYNILDISSRYLKQKGELLYSTCTLNKKENEKVVSRFLDNNSNYELLKEVTIFPSQNGGDGFFYAKLKKND